MTNATVGPTFSERGHTAVVVAIEVSAIAHEAFRVRPARRPGDVVPIDPERDHGPPRSLGVAASVGTGVVAGNSVGSSAYASAGLDYLPFLFESGGMVGFGGHVAVSTGARVAL